MESITNWVTVHFTTWYGYLIAIFAGIGGLLELWDKLGGRLMLKIWPTMENWTATTNVNEIDAELPIHGVRRWCSDTIQQKDDYYQIDMQKNRLISKVELISDSRYPKEYKIEIATNSEPENYEIVGTYKTCSSHPISQQFKNPKRFRYIRFTNTDPDQWPNKAIHAWCIYGIRFWEKRLIFNCLIKIG